MLVAQTLQSIDSILDAFTDHFYYPVAVFGNRPAMDSRG